MFYLVYDRGWLELFPSFSLIYCYIFSVVFESVWRWVMWMGRWERRWERGSSPSGLDEEKPEWWWWGANPGPAARDKTKAVTVVLWHPKVVSPSTLDPKCRGSSSRPSTLTTLCSRRFSKKQNPSMATAAKVLWPFPATWTSSTRSWWKWSILNKNKKTRKSNIVKLLLPVPVSRALPPLIVFFALPPPSHKPTSSIIL